MVAIFPNQGIENLSANNTPPAPKGFPRTVESFVGHDSITAMAPHDHPPQSLLFKNFLFPVLNLGFQG
jgi:hypothetical protein